jgi:3-oxoadipate enol-lactonase
MWDGFDLPGEVRRHPLPAPLDETVGDEPTALVGASYGGFVSLDFAARKPELVEKLVLLDAPLMDHEFSPEFMDYVAEEERLYEAGDMDALVELNLAFWCPGEHDKPDFRAIAERLASELPDARLEVIAGAGHLPSMERPEATAALVRGFLEVNEGL